MGIYNAVDNGVKGGGGDDTVALKAMFAAMATSSAHRFVIPDGEYLTGDTLEIPQCINRSLRGTLRGVSIIKMTADNKPILQVSHEDTHSFDLGDLSLTYGNNQPKTNTLAVPLSFNFTSANGSGAYHWTVQRLRITNSCNGIKLQGTGQLAIWDMFFDDIWFSNISRCAINIAGGGMPNNLWRNIKVLNTQTTNTDPTSAVFLGAHAARFQGLDIEGWFGNAISVSGGAPVTFEDTHIEWHVFDTDNEDAISLADGPVSIDHGSISFSGTSAIAECRLIKLQNAGASLILDGFTSTVTGAIAGSGKVRGLAGAVGSRIWATGCKWTPATNFTEYRPSTSSTDLYARVTEDGMAPIVDAYPVPSATYRSRSFQKLGGTGVADEEAQCQKNASDAYVWAVK